MKKNLLNKVWLRVCMIVAVVTTAFATTALADEFTIGWGSASGTNSQNFSGNSGTAYVGNNADNGVIVSFSSAQNGSRNVPHVSESQLVLAYGLNSSGNGGSITLTPGWGVTITKLEITGTPKGSQYVNLNYAIGNGSPASVSWSNGEGTINTSTRSPLTLQNVISDNQYDFKITTIKITYTKESWTNTTTTIDASGITNTDLFNSSSAGSLSATVTPGNGAVTWSSSNDAVATINSNGAVTLHHAGSVTFTATFEGVWGSYNPSSAKYQMTVTNSQTEPNKWVKTELSQLTSSDIFVIASTASNGKTYALPNVNSSSAPVGVEVEVVTDGNNVKRINSTVDENIKWNTQNTSDGYIFYPNGDSGHCLYCNNNGTGTNTSSNNNIKVFGTSNTTYRKHFKLSNNKLYVDQSSSTVPARYLALEQNSGAYKWYGKVGADNGSTIEFYKLVLEPNVNVMISEIGYSSLYYGEVNLEVPAGVEAYTYILNGTNLEVSKTYKANTSDNVIPAGEAVVLKGAKNTSYSFNVSAPSNTLTPDAANVLKGTDVRALTSDVCSGSVFYALSHKGGQNVGFYWAAANGGAFECPAHKAFLAADSQIGSVKSFIFEDEGATGIVSPLGETEEGAAIYNVAGQRLSKMQKGINIVNGKKILF